MDQNKQFFQKTLVLLCLISVLGVLFWFAYSRNTATIDWYYSYYPATRALIEFRSPYENNPYFFAPFWALIPLIPFAILPYDIGRALFFVVSMIGFAYLGYRAGGKPFALVAFLFSAPVANCIQTGNIEWIPLLGIFMPAPLGLVFLAMKPQSTIGIIIFVLVLILLEKGLIETIKTIIPAVSLFIISVLLYGTWFLRTSDIFAAGGPFIVSAWPYGLPIGIFLLVLAIKRKELCFALASSPLLSPYAILLTWSGFILSFIRSTKLVILISLASWVFWILHRFLVG